MVAALAAARVLLRAGALITLILASRTGEFKDTKWLPWALLFLALSV